MCTERIDEVVVTITDICLMYIHWSDKRVPEMISLQMNTRVNYFKYTDNSEVKIKK
jgi:hypothetical protein